MPKTPTTPPLAPPRPERPLPWHAAPQAEVLARLDSNLAGLDPAQVSERQVEFGPNALPAPRPPGLVTVVVHQFKSPLIYILLVAGAIALATGDYKDAAFILAVIILNAAIGTFQEYRAEQSAHALQQMLKVRARVRRADREAYVDAEELVPGDVVLIESGDRVPADLRLAQASNLAIDESFLTGESLAADKYLARAEPEASVGDRHNMAYAGSTVMAGRGLGLVVATGHHTEVGKIARTVAEEVGAKPPLVLRMERFARDIAVAVLVFATLLGLVALGQGMGLTDVLFLMIAMAVSAIPEGLPVAITVALSLATSRMARRNVIVRRLPAVESLGSCTTIASDKTGTLTVNQQTVRVLSLAEGARVLVSGEGYNDRGDLALKGGGALTDELRAQVETLGRLAVLCNEASLVREGDRWLRSGDAMDLALLALAYKAGLDPVAVRAAQPTLAHIPFESERRYAATLSADGDQALLVVKGAVETVLDFCTMLATAGGQRPLDAAAVQDQALALAGEGYRVLALAAASWADPAGEASRAGAELTGVEPVDGNLADGKLSEDDLADLTLQGLVGFIDPVRPEAPPAVATAHRAGLRVVMITGDHPATALAIARELEIAESEEQVVTGAELAEIGDVHVPAFYERVKRARVFARVSPNQKLEIVDALMGLGHFVAVTGDGVNDAPALRKANIGVAMGSGTDVAKDTAALIVTDDNFASIVAGVEEGRHAYANVRKVTLLLISTGLAELVLIGLSVLTGLPVPLLAVQILWLNLVTNGIQDVALAFEAGEPGVMDRPPRPPAQGLFDRRMIQLVSLSALTMAAICFTAYVGLLNAGWSVSAARSAILTLLVLLQIYHVLNCRSETTSLFRVPLRNNPVLILGSALALGLHIFATETPFMQSVLQVEDLNWRQWLLLAIPGVLILIVVEVYKAWTARRSKMGGGGP